MGYDGKGWGCHSGEEEGLGLSSEARTCRARSSIGLGSGQSLLVWKGAGASGFSVGAAW